MSIIFTQLNTGLLAHVVFSMEPIKFLHVDPINIYVDCVQIIQDACLGNIYFPKLWIVKSAQVMAWPCWARSTFLAILSCFSIITLVIDPYSMNYYNNYLKLQSFFLLLAQSSIINLLDQVAIYFLVSLSILTVPWDSSIKDSHSSVSIDQGLTNARISSDPLNLTATS